MKTTKYDITHRTQVDFIWGGVKFIITSEEISNRCKAKIMSIQWADQLTRINYSLIFINSKRSFVVASVADIPEKYENVKTIIDKLGLNEFDKDFKVVTDLKLQNVLNGIQAARATYPCSYGKCRRPTTKEPKWTQGEDRTIQSVIDDNEAWTSETNININGLKDF